MSTPAHAPAVTDYSLIGDCHSCALVSPAASIDWCCFPRFDSGSSFGRLLDRDRGGHCSVNLDGAPAQPGRSSYLGDTLVLETLLHSGEASVRVLDGFAMRANGSLDPRREVVRVMECVRGSTDAAFEIAPRFDYGEVRPWLRRAGESLFTATGGDDALMIWSDGSVARDGDGLIASAALRPGESLRLLLRYTRPHLLAEQDEREIGASAVDARLQESISWWERWRERIGMRGSDRRTEVRSALTLKALTYSPTGAIVAAATTSLPEQQGGERNWDYRYSWIRDSTLTANALAELGCGREADRFRRFIMRSAAGHADDLQILFGVGGERRTTEIELALDGYRGSRPVRIGNRASEQLQLDAPGEILDLAWRWHCRGHSPDEDEWRFLSEVVEMAAERWREPDRGIWEWRAGDLHFVHSKACCWAALECGLMLAEEGARRAPARRWESTRDEIRDAIEEHGYDHERGVFVQCFDEPELDASALLLPVLGFVAFDDDRMMRTADAIHTELGDSGFVMRYRRDDGRPGREGAFLACSFWLARCYAEQGRLQDASDVYDRAVGASSAQGLFSEQVDPRTGEALGNYPQTLTHLSHIDAASALRACAARVSEPY